MCKTSSKIDFPNLFRVKIYKIWKGLVAMAGVWERLLLMAVLYAHFVMLVGEFADCLTSCVKVSPQFPASQVELSPLC